MTDVATPVESSTPAPAAVEAPTHNFDPATFTPEETTAWMEKGTIPAVKAESAPAKEEKPVVAPESATGSQQQEQKGKGAEARIRELVARNKALEAEISAKADVKPAVKAESSTAPKVEKPVAPRWGEKDGETWEQFESRQQGHVEALVKYQLAEERKANEKQRLEAETAAQNKAIEDGWNARRKAAEEKRSDWAEVALSKDLPISAVMDGFILDSDVGPEILYYLGTHLDEGKAISAMPAFKAARALVAIENKLAEPQVAATPKPAVAPITKAARPATDLKATNGAPVDEVAAAVEANDFAAFAERRNAADIARRKGK